LSPTWLKRLSESGYSRCVFSTVRNMLSSATPDPAHEIARPEILLTLAFHRVRDHGIVS
jgi:hypothetical protein